MQACISAISQHTVCLQVTSLETALSQAQVRLAEHSSGSEVRAARAEQDRWRWQSEAEELRGLLASRDREIGKMQIKQEACLMPSHSLLDSLLAVLSYTAWRHMQIAPLVFTPAVPQVCLPIHLPVMCTTDQGTTNDDWPKIQ